MGQSCPPGLRECKPEEASGVLGSLKPTLEPRPPLKVGKPPPWSGSEALLVSPFIQKRQRLQAGLSAGPCPQPRSLPGPPHSLPSSGRTRNLLLQEEPVILTRGKRRTCHRAHPWSHGERGQAQNLPTYLLNQPHQQLQKEELEEEEEEEGQGECSQPSKPWSSPTTPGPSKAPACRFLSTGQFPQKPWPRTH